MNSVDEQVHRLAKVRDAQLEGRASGAGARALLASIVAETEPAPDERELAPRRRFRLTPRLLAVPVLTGLAAAVIVIPGALSGNTPPGMPPSASQLSDTAETGPLAARKILLAAAETAAHQAADDTRGRYWYVRQLHTNMGPLQTDEDYVVGELIALREEFDAKATKLSGKIEEIKALALEYRQKIERVEAGRQKNSPYSVKLSYSNEYWNGWKEGDVTRFSSYVDPKVEFTSPADEQKWKELGSPDLGIPKEPTITDSKLDRARDVSLNVGICTVDECGKLPTDKAGMDKWLKRNFTEDYASATWGFRSSYPEYLATSAWWMMLSPITPEARAAYLQVLADQPGITSLGKVTDPLGRTGFVLAMTYTSNWPDEHVGQTVERRFFLDDQSTKILASSKRFLEESAQPAKAISANEDWSGWDIIENSGWVDKLDERP